jgi:hypothetical protein
MWTRSVCDTLLSVREWRPARRSGALVGVQVDKTQCAMMRTHCSRHDQQQRGRWSIVADTDHLCFPSLTGSTTGRHLLFVPDRSTAHSFSPLSPPSLLPRLLSRNTLCPESSSIHPHTHTRTHAHTHALKVDRAVGASDR